MRERCHGVYDKLSRQIQQKPVFQKKMRERRTGDGRADRPQHCPRIRNKLIFSRKIQQKPVFSTK
jgi:hypothetical protein